MVDSAGPAADFLASEAGPLRGHGERNGDEVIDARPKAAGEGKTHGLDDLIAGDPKSPDRIGGIGKVHDGGFSVRHEQEGFRGGKSR